MPSAEIHRPQLDYDEANNLLCELYDHDAIRDYRGRSDSDPIRKYLASFPSVATRDDIAFATVPLLQRAHQYDYCEQLLEHDPDRMTQMYPEMTQSGILQPFRLLDAHDAAERIHRTYALVGSEGKFVGTMEYTIRQIPQPEPQDNPAWGITELSVTNVRNQTLKPFDRDTVALLGPTRSGAYLNRDDMPVIPWLQTFLTLVGLTHEDGHRKFYQFLQGSNPKLLAHINASHWKLVWIRKFDEGYHGAADTPKALQKEVDGSFVEAYKDPQDVHVSINSPYFVTDMALELLNECNATYVHARRTLKTIFTFLSLHDQPLERAIHEYQNECIAERIYYMRKYVGLSISSQFRKEKQTKISYWYSTEDA